MDPIWHHFVAPVAVGIISLPIAACVIVWLTRRRQRAGATRTWAFRSSLAEVGMIVGTVPWVWMTMTPNPGHIRGKDLVPFRDLANQFHVGLGFAAVQIIGNLLVFAALGFFLPVRFRVGPGFVLVVGVVASSTIEILQWVLHLGRFSSVDDVMVNTAGAVIAALLSRPLWRSQARLLDTSDAGLDRIDA